MAAIALASALGRKLAKGELKIADSITLTAPKTKELAGIINNLTNKKTTLLVVANDDTMLRKAGANIARLDVVKVRDLSVYDILTHANVVMDTNVMKLLEKLYE